jgi:hypothetical protein
MKPKMLAWQSRATKSLIFVNFWLTWLIPLSIHNLEPTLLYGDNIGAITTATNPDGHRATRSRHIDVRYHITREALANGTLRLQYIRTADMTADILTKSLPIEVDSGGSLCRHIEDIDTTLVWPKDS